MGQKYIEKNIEIGKVQSMLEWFKTKLYLTTMVDKAKSRKVHRGEVYMCNFGKVLGQKCKN